MRKLALIAVFLLMGSTVYAVPTVFFGEDPATLGSGLGPSSQAARNAFLAGLTGVGNEDFESFAPGNPGPLVLNFPGSSGGLQATLSGGDCVDDTTSVCGGIGSGNPGRFPTSGEQFWETSSGGSFLVTFDTPVNAFGFNATDVGDFNNRLVIRLTDVALGFTDFIVPHSLLLPNLANSTLFWGFIDPDIAYVSAEFFNQGTGGDVFAFDDMVVGDREQIRPIPEPATLLLLGAGLAGLGLGRRRRGC